MADDSMKIGDLIEKLQQEQKVNPNARVDVVGYYTIQAGRARIPLVDVDKIRQQ